MTDSEQPSTANLCDAALALGAAARLHLGARALDPLWRAEGRACCVRHFGSVDIFLEAIDRARPGDVLVIDNGGRDDEGCIGDLVVLEAKLAELGGILLWGRHRDSAELRQIGLPVFSHGACSTGPVRLDPRTSDAFGSARIGDQSVFDGDWIVADEDGAVIFGNEVYAAVRQRALEIRGLETVQAKAMRSGSSLRDQLDVGDYVDAREKGSKLTFRQHLTARKAAIEV